MKITTPAFLHLKSKVAAAQVQERPPKDSSYLEIVEKTVDNVDQGVVAPSDIPKRFVLKKGLFEASSTFAFDNLGVKAKKPDGDKLVLEDSSTRKPVVIIERKDNKLDRMYHLYKTRPIYEGQDPIKTNDVLDLYPLASVQRTSTKDLQVIMDGQADPAYTLEKAGIPSNDATKYFIKQVGEKEEVASTHPWKDTDYMLVVKEGVDATLMVCFAAIMDDADISRPRKATAFDEKEDKADPTKLFRSKSNVSKDDMPSSSVAVTFWRLMTIIVAVFKLLPYGILLLFMTRVARVAAAVDNDVCGGAIQLTLVDGTTVVDGTTEGASKDNDVGLPYCGTSIYNAPGIWYQFQGSGLITKASTCVNNYKTKLHVYTGTCGGPTCVAGGGSYGCYPGSVVYFSTVADQTYYLLVSGSYSSSDFGTFSLELEEFETPDNDLCGSAIELTLVDGTAAVNGTTEGASKDNDIGLPFCGTSIYNAPGIWYKLQGSGSMTKASTCVSDYDTKLHVYSGTCEVPVCVGGNNDACNQGSAVYFDTVDDQTYYILVSGDYYSDDTGKFTLDIEEILPPENDLCEGALPLTDFPVTLSVDKLGATSTGDTSNILSDCQGPGTEVDSSGVWYTVVSTEGGTVFKASPSCDSYGQSTKISVFTGTCGGGLSCVASYQAKSACYYRSSNEVSWDSVANEIYYVLVHGGSTDFTFTIQEVIPPDNDRCDNAMPLTAFPAIAPGNTVNATVDLHVVGTDCTGNPITDGGVWYTVVSAIGNTVFKAKTCGASYQTIISVYTGTCGSAGFECVAAAGFEGCGNGYGSELSWGSQANEIYYVLVHGKWSTGSFQLTIYENVRPENVECSSAAPLAVPSITEATTELANYSQDPADYDTACQFYSMDYVGPHTLWYKVVGKGNTRMRASTCNGDGDETTGDTEFNNGISVYKGSCGGGLICVVAETAYNTCENGVIVTWFTEEDEEYFVLVHGENSGTRPGRFKLDIREATIPENNERDAAVAVAVPSTTAGTTAASTTDYTVDYYCGDSSQGSRQGSGVWYTVEGTGNPLTLMTSMTDSTEFSERPTAIIVLHEGECVGVSRDAILWGSTCGIDTSSVSFQSNVSATYQILIHTNDRVSEGRFSDFVLTVDGTPATPANDDCTGAKSLNVSTTAAGYTNGFPALLDSVPDCTSVDDSLVTSNGVWYQVSGTGYKLIAATCTKDDGIGTGGANFDTKISVYESGCEENACANLVCVTGNDDFVGGTPPSNNIGVLSCGLGSLASWDSIENRLYWILVHGSGNATGSFDLAVLEGDDKEGKKSKASKSSKTNIMCRESRRGLRSKE